MQTAFLNGEYLPLAEASVPVLDRGFLLGDGVYEVLPAYHGRPFLLPAHIARLKRSLSETGIADSLGEEDWSRLIQELVNRNGGGDQFIYIQITRGVQAQRNHRISGDEIPTILAFCQPWPAHPADLAEKGVACTLHDDNRWMRCDIKTISLLPNVLLADAASRLGCNETLLIRDDMLGEGASSNVFVYQDNHLLTPPKSLLILHGVTRALIIELAGDCGIPVSEAEIPAGSLTDADEVMITSSTREIFPVTRINDQAVGSGIPGNIWRQLYAAYQARKNKECLA